MDKHSIVKVIFISTLFIGVSTYSNDDQTCTEPPCPEPCTEPPCPEPCTEPPCPKPTTPESGGGGGGGGGGSSVTTTTIGIIPDLGPSFYNPNTPTGNVNSTRIMTYTHRSINPRIYPDDGRCWFKPVMTDRDYILCGATPPR